MNKLLLTVAALITAAGTAPVSAYALAGNASTQATAVRTGFVEIDPSELPQAVRYAIASRYASSSIEKAYANAGIRLYKITVPNPKGTEITLLLDAQGTVMDNFLLTFYIIYLFFKKKI